MGFQGGGKGQWSLTLLEPPRPNHVFMKSPLIVQTTIRSPLYRICQHIEDSGCISGLP
jgi:hypothetical protein